MAAQSWRCRRFGLIALLLTVQLGVAVGESGRIAAQNRPGAVAPPVWPTLVADVTLSEKAQKKLEDGKETLRVFGYYSGSPRPGAAKRFVSEEGEVELGSFDMQFPLVSSAKIEGVKAKVGAFQQTDGKTPMLLINVVSGRKSSKNNLLECSIFQDRLDKIQGGHIPIACKLIGE